MILYYLGWGGYSFTSSCLVTEVTWVDIHTGKRNGDWECSPAVKLEFIYLFIFGSQLAIFQTVLVTV